MKPAEVLTIKKGTQITNLKSDLNIFFIWNLQMKMNEMRCIKVLEDFVRQDKEKRKEIRS